MINGKSSASASPPALRPRWIARATAGAGNPGGNDVLATIGISGISKSETCRPEARSDARNRVGG
jgi:hypothetical protein